ncbi:hypothetical protein FISHEDRAFT_62389 [Fistulina hepatica ATCC 64428]|nr:hypothetical protein FISHEDRAFT_62389 [Fistulina hepatica ATCC 64428]
MQDVEDDPFTGPLTPCDSERSISPTLERPLKRARFSVSPFEHNPSTADMRVDDGITHLEGGGLAMNLHSTSESDIITQSIADVAMDVEEPILSTPTAENPPGDGTNPSNAGDTQNALEDHSAIDVPKESRAAPLQ